MTIPTATPHAPEPLPRADPSSGKSLEYWQVNIDPSHREATCPPYLKNISEKDEAILRIPDANFTRLTWEEVQAIVRNNRIADFQRVPSELRRYLKYNWTLKQEYGSVMDFVLKKRLDWEKPFQALGLPFAVESDYKVLHNDWPYGIDEKITHLVVWCKFGLDEKPGEEALLPQTKRDIQGYVDQVFTPKVGQDNVIWFKNWERLKSVKKVEHFHIMIYDPEDKIQAFIDEITNYDVPLYKKARKQEHDQENAGMATWIMNYEKKKPGRKLVKVAD